MAATSKWLKGGRGTRCFPWATPDDGSRLRLRSGDVVRDLDVAQLDGGRARGAGPGHADEAGEGVVVEDRRAGIDGHRAAAVQGVGVGRRSAGRGGAVVVEVDLDGHVPR